MFYLPIASFCVLARLLLLIQFSCTVLCVTSLEQLFCHICYFEVTKSSWGTLQLLWLCYVSYKVYSSCADCHWKVHTSGTIPSVFTFHLVF